MPPPMNHRTACTLLAAVALAAGLSACAPLIVGSTVVGGVLALDRRTTGTQIEDEGIELRAVNLIVAALGERTHVNVTSYNRQVLLTSEVPGAAQRQGAQEIVGAGQDKSSVGKG